MQHMNKAVDAGTRTGNSQKAKRGSEFPGQPLLVRTIFGVSIAPPASMVYVKLGEEYIRKPLEEVKKGEELLFGKEGIPNITIEKAGEALAKSERYAATQPILFTRQADGSYTTAFRHALLAGMASVEGWPVRTPCAAAAAHIQTQLLGANVPAVSENQIQYGWIGGKTLAPANKGEVFPALLPIAPGLYELLKPAFDEAYKLYIVIRQSVMRSVSLILKGNASEVPKDEADGAAQEQLHSISTRPEIRLVVEHFATDITKEYAAARVLEVKALKANPDHGDERKGGEIFKGIVTHEVADPKIRVKPLSSLLRERSVLLPLLYRLIYDFLKSEGLLGKISSLDSSAPPSKVFLKLIATEKLGGADYSRWKAEKTLALLNKAKVSHLDKFFGCVDGILTDANWDDPALMGMSSIFYQKLYGGKLDSLYGLETGTLGKFFDYWFNLERGLPFDFDYVLSLKDIISAKKTEQGNTNQAIRMKEEHGELERIDKRLRKNHGAGISGKPVNEIHVAATFLSSRDLLGCSMDEQVYSGKMTPADALGQAGFDIKAAIADGLLSHDDAAIAVLREMGFGHLEPLFPKADGCVKPALRPQRLSGAERLSRFLPT